MAAPSYPLPVRAVDALRRGDTVEAIRILRATTPLDLKEAKNVVDAFRRGEPVSLSRPPAGQGESRSAAEARYVVAQTGIAEPLHKASGFGLAPGPDAQATSRFRDHPTGVGGRSPGEMPRTGPLLWWIVIAALAGYAVYSFLLRQVHV